MRCMMNLLIFVGRNQLSNHRGRTGAEASVTLLPVITPPFKRLLLFIGIISY